MVDVPAPTMVTTFFAIVATSVFELVYVKAPLLLVVGRNKVKCSVPNAFSGTEKFVIVGELLVTTRDAVIDPDLLFAVVV